MAFGKAPNPANPPKGLESIVRPAEGIRGTIGVLTTGVLDTGAPNMKTPVPDPDPEPPNPNPPDPEVPKPSGFSKAERLTPPGDDEDEATTGAELDPDLIPNENPDDPILPTEVDTGTGATEVTVEPNENAGVGVGNTAGIFAGKVEKGTGENDSPGPVVVLMDRGAVTTIGEIKAVSHERHFKDPLGFCT